MENSGLSKVVPFIEELDSIMSRYKGYDSKQSSDLIQQFEERKQFRSLSAKAQYFRRANPDLLLRPKGSDEWVGKLYSNEIDVNLTIKEHNLFNSINGIAYVQIKGKHTFPQEYPLEERVNHIAERYSVSYSGYFSDVIGGEELDIIKNSIKRVVRAQRNMTGIIRYEQIKFCLLEGLVRLLRF